ncbi:MAG: succinate dehydrogenase assembly factor 2 [Rhodobacteraceae bacterium]|nr:succinate dehydrogenase assembly factor 2 [Paracoccaceae bacterium]
MAAESRETRLKRLRLRAWRRGTREADLLLGGFADGALDGLDKAGLDGFEALLAENDHDILAWITGLAAAPPQHEGILRAIAARHRG